MFWSPLQSLRGPLPRNAGRARRPRAHSTDRRRKCPLAVEPLEGRLLLATFVVKNNNDAGADSLRQAITNANASAGNIIHFAITGSTSIRLASALPTIMRPGTVIDGSMQSPIVELDGTNVAPGASGLELGSNAGGSSIRGLVINRFSTGITVRGSGNTIAANFIGTDVTGSVRLGNAGNGIDVFGNNNTIGGPSFQDGNVISGNGNNGIRLFNEGNRGGGGNTVVGNFIGTGRNGTGNLANGQNGILLDRAIGVPDGANNNHIGIRRSPPPDNSVAYNGNVIAFNNEEGVLVALGNNNEILHNSIHDNVNRAGRREGGGIGGAGGGSGLPAGPVLGSAVTDGTAVDLAGTFRGAGVTDYVLEFFSNNACDSTNFGQGQIYLGSQSVRTDSQGNVSFLTSINAFVPLIPLGGITATATGTGEDNTTSRFSQCLAATSATHATHFSIVALTNPVRAGDPFSIRVTALNFGGMVATDYTGPIHFTSSDLNAVLPGDYTFSPADRGVHIFTVTLKTTGTQSISAEGVVSLPARTLVIRGTTTVTVNPGPVSSLMLAIAPDQIAPVVAGSSFKVVATAQDAFGNIKTDYTGTIHFTSNDRDASLPPDTPLAGGRQEYTVLLVNPGRRTITITDTGSPSLTATLVISLPRPASATTLTSSPNPSSLGDAVTFTATVAGGGRRGTATGTVTFIEGRVALGSGTLNSDGVATFTISTLSVGRHTIQAVYSGDDNFSDSTSFGLDQDVGNPGAVFTANERFVRQLYLDLLHRPADLPGLAVWLGSLDQGHSRTEIAQAIANSRESRTQIVQGVYNTYLHRRADSFGLSAWIAFLNGGGTVEQFETLVVGSTEYFQARGGGSNSGFLDALYQDALGRGIDPTGRAAFGGALDGALASRAQVAQLVFASPEYRQDLVRNWYRQYLHRDIDFIGLSYFVGSLQHGARDENIIAALLGSEEYFSKV